MAKVPPRSLTHVGSFGSVYLCATRDDNKLRAVKIINKNAVNPPALERFMNEVAVMKQMDHPNVLRLYEIFQDSKSCYLITE